MLGIQLAASPTPPCDVVLQHVDASREHSAVTKGADAAEWLLKLSKSVLLCRNRNYSASTGYTAPSPLHHHWDRIILGLIKRGSKALHTRNGAMNPSTRYHDRNMMKEVFGSAPGLLNERTSKHAVLHALSGFLNLRANEHGIPMSEAHGRSK